MRGTSPTKKCKRPIGNARTTPRLESRLPDAAPQVHHDSLRKIMITNITKAENKLEKKEHFWNLYIVTELLYENDKHKISWNNVISVQRSIGFLAPGVSTDLIRKWVGRNLGFQS